jgi:nanoRNase/pAp phosphatase (c-di-AMP/oligoRNAs hydrolase)
MENLTKEENNCLKKENELIRDNIRRATNMINGHRSDSDSLAISKDLQILLSLLENQRSLISSFEQLLESTQQDYERLLERSLQEARISSNRPNSNNYLAEMVAKEEAAVSELQIRLRDRITQTAKELSEVKSAQIHQNAELLQNPIIKPSKSPTIHKSGARLNELKKNKYLSPID